MQRQDKISSKERKELRIIRRMISNREYAQTSRDRKKAELQKLREECETLKTENAMLREHLEEFYTQIKT